MRAAVPFERQILFVPLSDIHARDRNLAGRGQDFEITKNDLPGFEIGRLGLFAGRF